MSDRAELRRPAPQRLIDWLAKEGFDVELLITRADEMTIDPGAEVPDADEPIDKQEQKNIDGLVAAYDATEPWDADIASGDAAQAKAEQPMGGDGAAKNGGDE